MEAVINPRCDLIRSCIEEKEIYDLCGVNRYEAMHNIASQIERDVKAYLKTSWGGMYKSKFENTLIMIWLIKRRSKIHDDDGIKWCVDRMFDERFHTKNKKTTEYPSW